MSGKPAAIPLFADAYLADTMHLSTEEHGAYLLLLMAAWRQPDCALPNDDGKLARIAGVSRQKWASIKETILDFWDTEEGRIFQSRLRRERAWVAQKSEASKKSAEARWNKQPTENKQDEGMRSHSVGNAPPPPPSDVLETNVPNTSQRDKRARAVRVPPDWQPNPLPENVAALVVQWPEGRLERELDGFRDYWTARVRNAAYSDWDRVWHNRIRDIHDRVMRTVQNDRQRSPATNGIASALDRWIGPDEPARQAGRPDPFDGRADRALPAPQVAVLR